MNLKINADYIKLLFFSISTSIVTYGFSLSNFSLSIDSESPIYPDYSMSLGRWGTNLIRYQLFEGLTPYFTLLLGLVLLSITAVELVKLFELKIFYGYIFCAVFLTFPQLAYLLVFTMQADVVPLGFLFSVVAVSIFINCVSGKISAKSISLFILSSLILMFVISLYQALILIPILCYLIHFFQNTYKENFSLKSEIIKSVVFGVLLLFSAILYYISVKLICPPVDGGYLSSYTSGESNNRFSAFYTLLIDNLKGNAYYGEKSFLLCTIICLLLIVRIGFEKRLFVYRFICLFLLMVLPFIMSFFITNNYHPPRIYLTSGIVFAFVFVHFVKNFKADKLILILSFLFCIAHIYFITELFYSNYKIYNHDKEVAKKIDFLIHSKYPQFDPTTNYVYFYGYLPFEHHQKFRLPNSEVFGGSLFSWDNGSNHRIINFFSYNDIAYYNLIDDKETFLSIKDSLNSILPLPVWPRPESIKMIKNVVVVKLGKEKGSPLRVE